MRRANTDLAPATATADRAENEFADDARLRAESEVARAPVSDSAFLAVDFETATSDRASACAVGFALFDDGLLCEQGTRLIDPGIAAGEWNPYNAVINGVRPQDVAGAPCFEQVWDELQSRFGGVPLVAHHATFDIGVLRAELRRADMRLNDAIQYTCSASLARIAWPQLLSVSLPILAGELGIELHHHDPVSDARASGQILLRAVHALRASTVADALHHVHREWGQIRPDLSATAPSTAPLRASDFTPDTSDRDARGPLYGQTIVITGTLDSMPRREAFQLIADAGAQPGDRVTKSTNILVVGEQDIARLAAGETQSAKQCKAADLRRAGHDIQLVSETEFLRMV